MKKISLEQLQKESRTESYPEQYRYICAQIEENKIMPVKNSPLNGKKPALHTSYWLVEEKPDYGEEIAELQFQTVPAIRTDYYLKHPEVYREERNWVRLLNRFFLKQSGARSRHLPPVSLNERSFQIWGREKFLQREQGRKILAHCGISLEELHVYRTTEPLAYCSRTRQVPQTILILENKDTFYTMRRWLMGEGAGEANGMTAFGNETGEAVKGEANEPYIANEPGGASGTHKIAKVSSRKIFGKEIATVIYGAGKGILRSFEDFRFCVEPHINHPENEILYFGDLDYEGIGIYERLAALFCAGEATSADARFGEGMPSGFVTDAIDECIRKTASDDTDESREIKPFIQAYEKMIEKADRYGKDFLPDMSGNQNHNLTGRFFQYFSHETKKAMVQLLEAGKYIPQEIVAITDF